MNDEFSCCEILPLDRRHFFLTYIPWENRKQVAVKAKSGWCKKVTACLCNI